MSRHEPTLHLKNRAGQQSSSLPITGLWVQVGAGKCVRVCVRVRVCTVWSENLAWAHVLSLSFSAALLHSLAWLRMASVQMHPDCSEVSRVRVSLAASPCCIATHRRSGHPLSCCLTRCLADPLHRRGDLQQSQRTGCGGGGGVCHETPSHHAYLEGEIRSFQACGLCRRWMYVRAFML